MRLFRKRKNVTCLNSKFTETLYAEKLIATLNFHVFVKFICQSERS